jgi:hypothetical protein
VDVIALALQEQLQGDQGLVVGHEAGQQQHRMAVAARRLQQQRQRGRQQRHFEQGARFQHRVQCAGLADVRMANDRVALRQALRPGCRPYR